ncbi:2'-5' RNA ligase family protein [Cytophagales bacterium LB-30]|uniref:2'-5' RNA ligase family protein n=1 Tax=Shiella aurantiaca TaxID=3058365 RepID=A0ABT8F5N0_9BACT|nr:2'-5' RNA ligase family protein [Shiella aurantiaca]MDN4165766.1 2'-5' RNA ligase family protein [Shiella aurantiaca]
MLATSQHTLCQYKVQVLLHGASAANVLEKKETLLSRGFEGNYLTSAPHINFFYMNLSTEWEQDFAEALCMHAERIRPFLVKVGGLESHEKSGTLFMPVKTKSAICAANRELYNQTIKRLQHNAFPIHKPVFVENPHITIVSGLSPSDLQTAKRILSQKTFDFAFQVSKLSMVRHTPGKLGSELILEAKFMGD